ncbi:MAG: ribosome biogenesis GTPase Der, partial [Ignavibacteria bacterium]
MSHKIVAIIGRPNVGKSTLFNRLMGRRIAIVHQTPGVTRDRNYGEMEWNGKSFFLIDTGGYVPVSKIRDVFETAIREQVKISIDESDIIIFMVDGQSGLTPLDFEIAKILRKESGLQRNIPKKIILTINKVDNKSFEDTKPEFYKLGLGEPFDISALVGRKTGDLLDLITENLQPDKSLSPQDFSGDDEISIKFAVIGRPNVGKSSLVNSLTQSSRNIVTDIPGTTRDSIDTTIKYYGKKIVLIDTAGLRKKSKIKKTESLEFYSVIRTHRSIERCDVAVIVIDAATILSKLKTSSDFELASFKLDSEDVGIIFEVAESKKGVLMVINKWDLIEKESKTAKIFENKVKEHLKTYNYIPFLFISALTKQRISRVLELAVNIYNERTKEIKTSELNSELLSVIKNSPPYSKSKREVKIKYITQLKT